MKAAIVCLAAAALGLAACSRKAADDRVVGPMTEPAQKTVIDTQLKALQKAKDVQKTVDQQKGELDKKVQDEGG